MNKISGIKIIIAIPILFLIFLFLLSRPWDSPTIEEIYLENYQSEKLGIISQTQLVKGCGLYIEFKDSNRKFISFKEDTASISIGNDCLINEQIQRNDYFQKIAKSNKCLIIRNDSIMLFDCTSNLDFLIENHQIPISQTNGWNLDENFKWFKMPYQPIEKYLNKEYYKIYKSNK